MKRRIYSFVLAIAMILGMCVMPAGAVEGPDLNLTLVTDTTAVEVSIEPLDLDETEYMAFESETYDAVSVQDDEIPERFVTRFVSGRSQFVRWPCAMKLVTFMFWRTFIRYNIGLLCVLVMPVCV